MFRDGARDREQGGHLGGHAFRTAVLHFVDERLDVRRNGARERAVRVHAVEAIVRRRHRLAVPALRVERPEDFSREELLRFLDRETAVARATDGRLAVLVVELRRVDRLQALLNGPAASTTMALVLERVRKSLRSDDRAAAINDDEVCIVLPRLAHPTQAVLAAVKVLRALDRPIAYEGGAAVLFGPHTWNFKDTVARLKKHEAAVVVADAAELERETARLLDDAAARWELGARARDFVLSQQGATDKTLAALDAVVPAPLPQAQAA